MDSSICAAARAFCSRILSLLSAFFLIGTISLLQKWNKLLKNIMLVFYNPLIFIFRIRMSIYLSLVSLYLHLCTTKLDQYGNCSSICFKAYFVTLSCQRRIIRINYDYFFIVFGELNFLPHVRGGVCSLYSLYVEIAYPFFVLNGGILWIRKRTCLSIAQTGQIVLISAEISFISPKKRENVKCYQIRNIWHT